MFLLRPYNAGPELKPQRVPKAEISSFIDLNLKARGAMHGLTHRLSEIRHSFTYNYLFALTKHIVL